MSIDELFDESLRLIDGRDLHQCVETTLLLTISPPMMPNGARRFESDGDGSPAPAVTRAAAILDALETAGGEPLGVSDLARSLGIAKSSTSHLCQALEDARLIQRRENGYVLGRRTIELAGAYLAGFDEVRSFYELCARTVALRQHVVQIAMLDGTDVLYLARYEGRSQFRMAANIGERFPAALTATGQALLAALPPAEVTRRFRGADIPHMTESSSPGVCTGMSTRKTAGRICIRRRGCASRRHRHGGATNAPTRWGSNALARRHRSEEPGHPGHLGRTPR